MRKLRLAVICAAGALAAFGAGQTGSVPAAAARAEQAIAKVSDAQVAAGLRIMAQKTLEPRYPEVARKFMGTAAGSRQATLRGDSVPPEAAAIQQRLKQMRSLPTDADRAKLAIEAAKDICALPAGSMAKLRLAQGLSNLVTEGDLGKAALTSVAGALAEAAREAAARGVPVDAGTYVQLASIVRYEHVPSPVSDPALDAADAILALRQAIAGENDFTLTALDGKQYTLSGLRGRVVLLNFWATWCPPCRKEMPDMDKLYKELGSKGFVVLGVSDEEREKVAGFIQKQGYTFPILLDPGRKVHEAFGVEGIPKSFLFDRQGKLAAESIDMRTERQFREMVKTAGLE